MGRVSLQQRLCIKRYLEEGKTPYEISNLMPVSRGSIRNLADKLKRGFGIEDLPKSGRKTKLSRRDVQRVIVQRKKFPFDAASAILRSTDLADKVSVSTV